MWPLERTQGYSKIWPSDLVFHPTRPIFELILDFIKTNILTNFHDNRAENMAYRVYTRQKEVFLLLCSNLWSPGIGQILSQGASYEQSW